LIAVHIQVRLRLIVDSPSQVLQSVNDPAHRVVREPLVPNPVSRLGVGEGRVVMGTTEVARFTADDVEQVSAPQRPVDDQHL